MRKCLCALQLLLLLALATALHAQGSSSLIVSDLRTDPARPGPLIVMLHGAGVSARSFRATTRFDAVARGAVVVYPEARGGQWRTEAGSPDVTYLAGLIAGAQSDPRIAARPALILGHGAGGTMALRLACDVPGLVAGLGLMGTKQPADFPCARARAVPTLFLHGTADPVWPYNGRPSGDPAGASLSATDTMRYFARRNGCAADVRARKVDRRGNDRTFLSERRYARCRAVLGQIIIQGGGHGWPTGLAGNDRRFGRLSAEINAGEAFLRFLGPAVGLR